jgi:predicted TIM-barrel fold metal-dependent hydrolase
LQGAGPHGVMTPGNPAVADFPHSDSTWPNSQALLARHAAHLSDGDRARILHDNALDLYGLHE